MEQCSTHNEPVTVQITQILPLSRDNETVHVCRTCLDNADEDVDEFFADDVVEAAHRHTVEILASE
ncbi:hypothetical protein [Halorussus halobius]|uniref:hypothetical protein n=1 Tax=Halorussus halobius TaxID=1710537 RepID=UPI001092B6C1|nr:hypothetical protein [Halorussus halobius]